MKAKLRAGKTGAKGRVKKYADGGMLSPDLGANIRQVQPAQGAASGLGMGKVAPPGMNLGAMLGASSGSPTGAPPPPMVGPRGFGPNDGGVRPPSVMQAGLAPMAPRGFGPNDGGPRPGMGPKGHGMGKPGMGHHGMGRPGTGGPMIQQMPMGSGGPPPRSMTPMASQQIMPEGRAFKKGGMVGCDWSPKSSTTMRGAARKGK